MPYCVQCGQEAGAADQFCSRCGTRQPPTHAQAGRSSAEQGAPGRGPDVADFWNTAPDRTVLLLCYLPWVGWIASIAVLASARFRRDNRVRFHAFQAIYLFVAWLLVEWVISPMTFVAGWGSGMHVRGISGLLHLILVGAWVFMLIKVNQNEDYRLPVLGDLADKSVNEQRI